MLEPEQLYNEQAEQALIGGVLIDPGSWAMVSDLQAGKFFFDRHKILWKAIRSLRDKGDPVDIISLSDLLTQKDKLKEVGGSAYITKLISTTPSSMNIEIYSKIVSIFHRRRQIVQYAGEMAKAAYNSADDALEVDALGIAQKVMQDTQGDNHLHHWGDEIGQSIDKVSTARENPREVWGISTGFDQIDAFSGGLHKSETFWIAGMPGIGKSILAAQLGLMSVMPPQGNELKAKGLGLFVLENTTQLTTMRLISGLAQIATLKLLTGYTNDDEYTNFLITAGDAGKLPVYHRDKPLTVPEFRAEVIRAKKLYNVEVIVLDYLYMMRATGYSEREDRTEIISRDCVSIMKDEGLAGIFVNSVTKEGFSASGAGMEAMRGSGQQMHDADTAALLLPVKDQPNFRKLKYVKGRNLPGSMATVALEKADQYPWFKPANSRTVDLSTVY